MAMLHESVAKCFMATASGRAARKVRLPPGEQTAPLMGDRVGG
jgi:hypothetical protein